MAILVSCTQVYVFAQNLDTINSLPFRLRFTLGQQHIPTLPRRTPTAFAGATQSLAPELPVAFPDSHIKIPDASFRLQSDSPGRWILSLAAAPKAAKRRSLEGGEAALGCGPRSMRGTHPLGSPPLGGGRVGRRNRRTATQVDGAQGPEVGVFLRRYSRSCLQKPSPAQVDITWLCQGRRAAPTQGGGRPGQGRIKIFIGQGKQGT